ncbi:hypothetical protein CHS0354_033609 [Potamilus streckersoni]|uniref:Chitin-binding type-2 domain-containing protein n=1 Tax=Potamilus streckersoni TaxID=2493646 RepID=A0AAE0T141_9BIVA|nr:hypothetical protein CHS0354_033609 [Potamilus streckersoni]
MYELFALLVLNTVMVVKMGIPYECSGVVSEGHAFGLDPNECGAFFECVLVPGDELLQTTGSYEIYRKNCGFGLFWSNTLLTCVLPRNLTDPPEFRCNDPCTRLPDGRRRPMFGNCGGFWSCNDRTSIGVCCPKNQLYDETTDTCIEDNTGICNNTDCNPPMATIIGCPLREFPEDKTKYIEEAYNEDVIRSCPKGTIFAFCGCIYDDDFDPSQVVEKECEPHFILDFDENDLSQPGIEFARVQIKSDAGFNKTNGPSGNFGHFNGNAFVLIYSLANSHSTNVRVINFMMRSVGDGKDLPQTVITNAINPGRTCRGFDCLGSIQIDIIQRNALLHYLVTTKNYYEIKTQINDDWTSVWWVFVSTNVRLFGAESLKVEKVKIVQGQLAERRTALVIGRPPSPLYGHHFTGDIDNFKVYNCIPKLAVDSLSFLEDLH